MPYTPRLTIAGRDLTKEWYEKLQREYTARKFNITLPIESISLVLAPCEENDLVRYQEVVRYNLV